MSAAALLVPVEVERRAAKRATLQALDQLAAIDAINARFEALLSTLLNVRPLTRAELQELACLEAQLLSLEVA